MKCSFNIIVYSLKLLLKQIVDLLTWYGQCFSMANRGKSKPVFFCSKPKKENDII